MIIWENERDMVRLVYDGGEWYFELHNDYHMQYYAMDQILDIVRYIERSTEY